MIFKKRAGIILCKNGKRAVVNIQKLAKIVAVLHAVKGIVKFKILQIGDAGNVNLDDGRLESEIHRFAPRFV